MLVRNLFCNDIFISVCLRIFLYLELFTASCSHTRSYNLFGESINSKEFIAKECSTYRKYKTGACEQFQSAIMGENVDQSVRGVFYLTTNGDQPFARNGTI